MTWLWLAIFGGCCFWFGCKVGHRSAMRWHEDYIGLQVAMVSPEARAELIATGRRIVEHFKAETKA